MQANLIAFILLVTIAALAAIRWLERRHHKLTRDKNTPSLLKPLDLVAFACLLDESDEVFIRQHLVGKDYRIARRKRINAAVDYVGRARFNATALLRIGERAVRSKDPVLYEDARRLVQLAMEIRHEATVALLRLRLALLFPTSSLNSRSVPRRYAELHRVAACVRGLEPSLFFET
jgi:hypothetical protein